MDQVPAGPGPVPGAGILSIAEIAEIVSEALDDERLQDIWIRGEITGYKPHQSGHYYFSLSEDLNGRTYVIGCIMWQNRGQSLDFDFKNGLAVIAFGNVQFHGPNGKLSFLVREIRSAGVGEKHLLVERWKRELEAEGLFAVERKKPLPLFPSRVGVATSRTGAVLQDIINIISRRYPLEIVLSPTAVQGDTAHLEIASAICALDGCVDVIIVGRGGGSFEDLFPFNHPDVVRAIAGCRTPVISAVGHETDFVLADFAADRRAPTPSSAAELAVPDQAELARDVKSSLDRLKLALDKRVQDAMDIIVDLKVRLHPRRIEKRINENRLNVAEFEEDLERAFLGKLGAFRGELARVQALLEGRSPLTILSRGYSIIEKDNEVIRSARELHPEDRVRLRMADGSAKTRVEEVCIDKEI
jgi:exodeoxyribonuclease VII large subunit